MSSNLSPIGGVGNERSPRRSLKLSTGYGPIKVADDTCTQQPVRRYRIVLRIFRSQITVRTSDRQTVLPFQVRSVPREGKLASSPPVRRPRRAHAMSRLIKFLSVLQFCVLITAQNTALDGPGYLQLYGQIRHLLFRTFGT